MKYIFLIAVLLQVTLMALEFGFDDLRKVERALVLKEFKKLYKERKNIHYNMRKVLKHARSKSLHKNNLSFFQAKKFSYKELHPLELSNVYLNAEVTCSVDCQGSLEIENIVDISPPGLSIEFDQSGIAESSLVPTPEFKKVAVPIRGSVVSPWARR